MNLKPRLCALALAAAACAATHAEDLTPDLKINGFATAGAAWLGSDKDSGSYLENSYGRAGIGKDVNTSFDSLVGLQLDYRVNEQTHLVTQLEALGQQDYSLQASWAYISYRLSNDWSVRAGREGFPGFMYTDTQDIGTAYPWVRPPAEVYASTPLKSLQGIEALWRHPLGEWTAGAQFTVGAGHSPDQSLTMNNGSALVLTLTNTDLLLRASRLQGTLNSQFNRPLASDPATNTALNTALDFHNTKASFTSLGVSYDDNCWMAQSEYVQQRVDSWASNFDAGYLTAGHYFGHWLPFVSWAQIHTVSLNDKLVPVPALGPGIIVDTRPFSDFDQSSLTLGLRVDPRPNLAVKFQIEHIYDFHGSDGLFRYPATSGPVLPSPTNLYSMTISTSF